MYNMNRYFSFPVMFPPALESIKCEDLLEEERLDVFGGRKNTRGKLFLVMLQEEAKLKLFIDMVERTTIPYSPENVN